MSLEHVMIDLETLSTRPTAAILSIGAVQFDPYSGKFGEKFYTTILTESCKTAGLSINQDTVNWWCGQGESAQKVLHDCMDFQTSPTLSESLSDLSKFVKDNHLKYPWSCGAGFDIPILSNAYAVTKQQIPWDFWNARCYRTMKALFRVDEDKFEGTAHNALDDAIHQAKHLCKIMGDE